MRRIRNLEYPWIFKNSFFTYGYTFKDSKRNTYVIWAKDIPDAKNLIGSMNLSEDGSYDYVKYIRPYFKNKWHKLYGQCVRKAPFWWRGRVYKINAEGQHK